MGILNDGDHVRHFIIGPPSSEPNGWVSDRSYVVSAIRRSRDGLKNRGWDGPDEGPWKGASGCKINVTFHPDTHFFCSSLWISFFV